MAGMTTLPTCELCNKPIDLDESILKQVVGWLRPQGTGGGQIVRREETGRFAHRRCVEIGVPGSMLW